MSNPNSSSRKPETENRKPYCFSRAQLGVILLLGAALLSLWAWRGNFGRPPSPPPARPINPVFVEVTGAASFPGVYEFPAPPTLLEVWRKARGPEPAPEADLKLASGNRVDLAADGRYQLGRMNGPRLMTLGLALDLNTATKEDLEALPGIGPALAQRIIDYRKAHGPFKKVEDLREVSGIGPQNLQKLKPYLGLGSPEAMAPPDWEAAMSFGKSVSGAHLESHEGQLPGSKSDLQPKTPGRAIDPNLASKVDLETLPGIGPVMAQRIIDYRRAHGPYKKIADLRKVSGIGRKKLAKLRPFLIVN